MTRINWLMLSSLNGEIALLKIKKFLGLILILFVVKMTF